MIKKLIYILPIAGLLFAGCSDNKNLKGQFSDSTNDGKLIYLFESEGLATPYEPVDSVIVKNGAFAFDRKDVTSPNVAFLAVKEPSEGTPEIIPFINENGDITIDIDSMVTVKGTKMNVEYQRFGEAMRVFDSELTKVSIESSEIRDDSQLEPYITKMQDIQKQQADLIYDYVKENIKNNVGEFFLISYASMLDRNRLNDLLGLASSELQSQMQPLLGGPSASTFVGKQYIDLKGDNPEGKEISLSSYVGKNKLVLIDFWASWCGPCIKEMPNVVAAYNKYKGKGFEIVGVSLDEEKSAWVNAIKKLNMAWPQMSDLKGWQSQLGAAYQVSSIPFTLLVDQEGRIIAENLRGSQLEEKLQEILK